MTNHNSNFTKLITTLTILTALTGMTAAAATDLRVQESPVQSGTDVTPEVQAGSTTDDVYIVLDEDGNGNYDGSVSDQLVTATISSTGTWTSAGSTFDTSSLAEGDYTVYAVQQSSAPGDGVDVSSGQSTTLTIDDTNPTARFNSVDYNSGSSATSGETVTINYDATDDNSIESATVRIKDGEGGTLVEDTSAPTGSSSSVNLDIPADTLDDVYTVEIIATDSAGNQYTDGAGGVTVDDKVTSLTIQDTEVQSSENTLTIDGTADSTADNIQFQVEDSEQNVQTYSKLIDSKSFSVDLDISGAGFAEGTTTLRAEQATPSFNSAESTGTFEIDNTKPSVNSVTVTDNEDDVLRDDESVTVEAEVTDTNTVDTVTADASNLNAGTIDLTQEADTDTYSATIDSSTTTVDSEGTATIGITATDIAGNSNNSKSADIEYDGANPVLDAVTIVSDNSDTSLAKEGDTITLDITASEDLASAPTVTVEGNSATVTDTGDSDASTWKASYTVSSQDVSEGEASFSISGYEDPAGNSGSEVTTTTDSSTVTIDTESLVIDNPSPSMGNTVTDNQVTYTADISDTTSEVDESTISVTLQDSESTKHLDQTSVSASSTLSFSSGTLTINPTNGEDSFEMAEGQVDVTVKAEDKVGNSATEFTSSFTVDTEAPSIDSIDIIDATDGNGILKDSDSVLVKVNVTDSLSDTSTVDIDASSFGVASDLAASIGGDSDYVGTFDVNSPGDGDYSVKVSATDAPGNGGNQDVESGTLTVDTNSPAIQSVEVEEGSRRATVQFSEPVSTSTDMNTALSASDFSYNNGANGLVDDISEVSHVVGNENATIVFNNQIDSDDQTNDQISFNGGVVDQAGNAASTTNVAFVDDRDQISLTSGWNLVSTPHLQADNTSELLDGLSVSSVLSYDDNEWKNSESEIDLNEMEAVFIKSDEPQEITLDRDAGVENTPQSEALESGWNLVGPSFNIEGESEFSANIATAFDGADIDGDDSMGLTHVVSPTGNWDQKKEEGFDGSIEGIEAFRGYWLFSKSQEVIS